MIWTRYKGLSGVMANVLFRTLGEGYTDVIIVY